VLGNFHTGLPNPPFKEAPVVAAVAGAAASSFVTGQVMLATGGFYSASLGTIIGGSTTLGAIAGGVAGAVVSGFVSSAFAGDVESTPEAQSRGILVNKSSNDAPIPVVYGQRKVGGTRVLMDVTGSSNNYLHIVLALCEGEIDSIENIYLNDVLSTDSRFTGYLDTYTHVGTDTQAADSNLVSAVTAWTTTHQLKGTAYIYARCKFSNDAYPTGIPTITADVKGVEIYDPRTTTTAWSNNPALCVRDYLTNDRYGRGISSTLIDDTSFNAAANYCEEQVTIGGDTVDRYTLNGVVDTSMGSMDILKRLLTACRGFLVFSGGLYKLVIDKPETAGFTFSEDNIVGGWNISLGSKNSQFNRIRANFFNNERQWQPDLAVIDSTSLRTADNGLLLEKTIDLPFTSDIDRAKMITTINLNQSRQQIMAEFTSTIEGLRNEVGDVVYISHETTGWDTLNGGLGKLFRIMRITLQNNDEVRVMAMEYDVTSYDFGTIAASDAAPNTNLPDHYTVGTVSDVIINAQDYIYNGQIDITWSSSAISFRDHILLTVDGVAGSEEVTRNSVTSTTPNTLSDPNVSIQKMMPVVGPVGFPAYDLILTLSAAERAKLGVNQVITMSGWSGTNATVFSDALWLVYNITDNSDSTTTLRIFAVEYRERFTSFPTSSALTIYTENTGLAKSNPAAYYYREYSIQDLDSYALDNLPHGTYEITLTPVNTLGVNGTPYTVGVTIDPPPVPDVKGVELDLGGDGQGNETEWTGKDCKIKWRAGTLSFSYSVLNGEDPNGAGYGAIDAYIKDFMVEVYNGTTLLRTEYVTDTWYTYTYEKNAEDAVKQSATPYRDLNFKIWARGRQNQISENVAVL